MPPLTSKAALSDADARLSDANDAYAAALPSLAMPKDALAAARMQYDKYHPKAEPQATTGCAGCYKGFCHQEEGRGRCACPDG